MTERALCVSSTVKSLLWFCMSISVTLMIAVLSSMPITCGLTSPPRSFWSRFGPKITARLAAVILFPGIWKAEEEEAVMEVKVKMEYAVVNEVCETWSCWISFYITENQQAAAA